MRILLVEDDEGLNKQLATALKNEGYAVDTAFDGEEGKYLGETESYDAIILDLGLPEIDGVSILKSWRSGSDNIPARTTPVLVLTARNTWPEKKAVFDNGADDYVTKPFHVEEILARLRAIIRRNAGHASAQIQWGPVLLDTASSRITIDGAPVDLTAHEFRLFSYLMHHRDKVLSRTELQEHIYDLERDPDSIKDSNTIDVFIARLRKRFPDGIIETIRGRGYRLSPPPDREE